MKYRSSDIFGTHEIDTDEREYTWQIPVNQWQPIETAPKDGSYILAWSGCWRHPFAGRYIGESFVLIDGADIDATQTRYFATHWMPLPDPPK